MLDESYAAWLEPQLRMVREADPTKPISVGLHDPLIASLPTNRQLSFITWHVYPPAGSSGQEALVRSLAALRSLYPDKPILLGEFGYRTGDRDEQSVGVDEALIWLRTYAEGYAGGLKWLLTDTRDGTDTMGAFRMDGTERPVVAASRALAELARTPPGKRSVLEVRDATGRTLCYAFRAEGSSFVGSAC